MGLSSFCRFNSFLEVGDSRKLSREYLCSCWSGRQNVLLGEVVPRVWPLIVQVAFVPITPQV